MKELTLFLTILFSSKVLSNDYIVCKDIGPGKIKCEDGIWGKTAEVGFTIDASKLRLRDTQNKNGSDQKPKRNCSDTKSNNGEFDSKGSIICGGDKNIDGEVPAMTENNGGNVSGTKESQPTK